METPRHPQNARFQKRKISCTGVIHSAEKRAFFLPGKMYRHFRHFWFLLWAAFHFSRTVNDKIKYWWDIGKNVGGDRKILLDPIFEDSYFLTRPAEELSESCGFIIHCHRVQVFIHRLRGAITARQFACSYFNRTVQVISKRVCIAIISLPFYPI